MRNISGTQRQAGSKLIVVCISGKTNVDLLNLCFPSSNLHPRTRNVLHTFQLMFTKGNKYTWLEKTHLLLSIRRPQSKLTRSQAPATHYRSLASITKEDLSSVLECLLHNFC